MNAIVLHPSKLNNRTATDINLPRASIVVGSSPLRLDSHQAEVEKIVNASKSHVVKGGNGVRDDLPGIKKNKFGYKIRLWIMAEICWSEIAPRE